MPTRKDLARRLVHAAMKRVALSGFADPRVSESVYLDDPEGNGLEVYADRDSSLWQWSEGSVTMATDELNIKDLLRSPIMAGCSDTGRPGAMAVSAGER